MTYQRSFTNPNIKGAEVVLESYLRTTNTFLIKREYSNQGRDAIYNTNRGIIYLKRQNSWKMKDPYNKDNQKKTVYATINQSLMSKSFAILVICTKEHKLYAISKSQIQEHGIKGENPLQNESVYHIPVQNLKPIKEMIS